MGEVLGIRGFGSCATYSHGGSGEAFAVSELWIELYLRGVPVHGKYGTGMRKDGGHKARRKRRGRQRSRAAPLCQIQAWEHSSGLCLSQCEWFQLPHTPAQ